MESKTLVHEDVYVYIDSIKEVVDTKTAANTFTFSNDALNQMADIGVIVIEVLSGSYSKVVITSGNKNTTLNIPMAVGEKVTLDFRNLHFAKGGKLYFVQDNIIDLSDNSISSINVTLTGTGSAKISRKYNKVQVNNDDLWFVESISVETNIERLKKTLMNGNEKSLENEKKVHSFSINGLWSQEEISKFTDLFRLRLVDEEGNKLENLANCTITSKGYSSSSGGDLTYAISGSCEKIF